MRLNKLGAKLTLILSLVFLLGIVASWAVLSRVIEQRAEAEVTARGLVLIEAMNSVRHYTTSLINPLLQDELAASATFIPESVPAFAAREVFETLRANPVYASYLYKEAADNPTNLRDLADPFESQLLAQFQADSALREQSGFTSRDGEHVFYSARPLVVTESCIACHGDPADAPASLIATYGPDNGFGWEVGQPIAAQIIYVPASDVIGSAQLWLNVVMIVVIGVFGLVLLALNILVRRLVVRPVEAIAAMAQNISAGGWTPIEAELAAVERVAGRGDELGHTARVFEGMAREVYERERRLKEQVRQLHIQIDEQKRESQVREITETDYFQDLQQKARSLRESRGEIPESAADRDEPADTPAPEPPSGH
jgi:HAMP domain-containing protein